MSTAKDPSLRHLDNCSCCQGLAVHTPLAVHNRPGLSAVSYRVGTQARFKQTMLARLSASEEGRAALQKLNTRDDDDFAIALLDAWATVADVLTFYQERIANEAFLNTATERLSIHHLARLLGYELKPGVAADTVLAFTVDDDPGTATVPKGTRVQSIPKEGELPQTFETQAKITAQAKWNKIKPRLTERHLLLDSSGKLRDTFMFKGIATGLQAGDAVTFSPDPAKDPILRLVAEVTPEPDKDRTKVTFQTPPSPAIIFGLIGTLLSASKGLSMISTGFTQGGGTTIKAGDLQAMALTQNFQVANVFANLKAAQPAPPSVLAFRKRAAILGHNAPAWSELSASQKIGEPKPGDPTKVVAGPFAGKTASDWVDMKNLSSYPESLLEKAGSGQKHIYLDNTYAEFVKASYIVLQDGGNWKQLPVQEASDVSKSAFTFHTKVTRLAVSDSDLAKFSIRNTTVFGQSEALDLARLPITKVVSGAAIELDGWYEGLSAGQSIVVCGELDKDRGNQACEHVIIDEVEHVLGLEGFTRLKLRTKLQNDYVRDTVTINANVAAATHGETRQEVLGSGDGGQASQRFKLKHKPLTHISATTNTGTESTLEVRVNDVRWRQADNLFELGPKDRKYVTETDDDGQTTVNFGDGVHGARLPSGTENVKATYRSGIGQPGNVGAEKITLLATRPPGVRGVTNPVAARGGTDPESRDQARRNAPLAVLTLGRIVSLQDYEDFARAFAGIGKALATWTWNGQERGVFVTVAGPKGVAVAKDRRDKLLKAMRQAGDPLIPLRVASYRPAWFRLEASVKIHDDHNRQKVLAAIEKAVRAAFSFEVRRFGQPAALSDVMAIIQAVQGVVAVDVDLFYRTDKAALLNTTPLPAALPQPGAAAAQPGASMVQAAELLLIDPRPIKLGVMT